MNKERRKVLKWVVSDLTSVQEEKDKQEALNLLKQAQKDTEECLDEERESLDNITEFISSSPTIDKLEQNIANLEDANAEIQVAINELNELDKMDYNEIKLSVEFAIKKIKETI